MKIIKDFFNTFTIPLILGIFCGVKFEDFAINELMEFGRLDVTEIRILAWVVGIWVFGIPFGFRTMKSLELKNQEYKRKIGDDSFYIVPVIPFYLLILMVAWSFSPIFSLIHIVTFMYRTITGKSSRYKAYV